MVKEIKIFALPSHQTKERTSGVDFARIIQPMNYLNGYCDGEVKFKVDIYDIFAKKQPNWIDISKSYDLVFFNYTPLDWAFAHMGAPIRAEGKKLIMDIDDAIWYVRRDNPTYEAYHKNNDWFIKVITAIINEVDLVITTSSYLKNVIADKTLKRHEQIKVIPNYIDLFLYRWRFKPVKKDFLNIYYFGSTTHSLDLYQKNFMEGLERLFKEFPNLKLVTVGAFIPQLRYRFGKRYQNAFGDVDIYKWINEKYPKFMADADIVVAPLEIDIYNRSKSFIKYLEYSSANKPGVYQDIDAYRCVIKQGKNGFLASSADEWYLYLKKLAVNYKLRVKIGNEAFKTVKKYQIQNHINEYAGVIKKVLTNK